MPVSDLHQDELRWLLDALHYDASRRYEILREELTHLINSVRYRIGPEASFGRTSAPYKAPSSHKAFLKRIGEAADTLLEESKGDIAEMEHANTANSLKWSKANSKEHQGPPVQVTDLARFEILWNAKCVNKAMVIAERMGDLHDRLEQFLQRTNPDHPDPTLRRRLEQGLTDKYLSELGRWTHRDLAEFVHEKYLGAAYVHDEIPSTFQFWAYNHTSHHHAFMTFGEHALWSEASELTADRRRHKASQAITNDRFVSVALSYWMPERPALVPIIGHELAHQVLRVVYGREIAMPLLERDMSALGSLYRRLHASAEQWLTPHVEGNATSAGMVNNLVNEIVCDSLAAVRFGWGYAYAWVLETVADERFAQLFQDRYGMLRRCEPAGLPTSQGGDTLAALKNDAEAMAKGLRGSLLAPLYRGQVLFEVLTSLDLESDQAATDLKRAFASLLSVLLFLYTDGDDARGAFEFALSKDLARSACWEAQGSRSEFIVMARRFWQSTPHATEANRKVFANPSLQHQRLSGSYRKALSGALKDILFPNGSSSGDGAETNGLASIEQSRMLTDLVWRTEWLLSKQSAAERAARTDDPAAPSDALRNQVRELLPLGMDDYLFRTGNPSRIFVSLASKDEREKLLALPVKSNYLYAVREAYSDAAIRQLEAQVKLGTLPARVDVGGVRIELAREQVAWLPSPIQPRNFYVQLQKARQDVIENVPDLRDVRKSVVYLDLVRLRAQDAVLHRDLFLPATKGEAASTAPSDVPAPSDEAKYAVMSQGNLLGRYDAYVFYTQKANRGRLGWQFGEETGAGGRNVAYVTRAKRLVRIWSRSASLNVARTTEGDPQLAALVLVSLTWESSRTIVARWLSTEETLKQFADLSVAVFLSDGWEDIVLAVAPPKASNGDDADSAMQRAVVACTALVRLLNRNPFVASTETLFTRNILRQPPDEFEFRFACRVGSDGYDEAHLGFAQAFAALKDDLLDDAALSTLAAGLREREVAGNKDFELPLPNELGPHALLVHRRLHESLATCRIETSVAWRRPGGLRAPGEAA